MLVTVVTSLRRGVGGQFPRNLTRSVLYFPVVMVCSRVPLASFWLIQIVVVVNRGNLYVDIKLQNWLFKWMLIHGHSPRSVQIYYVGHDLVCRKDAWWGFQTAQACSNFYYGSTIIRYKEFFYRTFIKRAHISMPNSWPVSSGEGW